MIDFEKHIIFADADVLVLDKPSGVVVNKADSNRESSIQEWLVDYLAKEPQRTETEWMAQVPAEFDDQYGSPQDIWQERKGLVHRLDKDTSGILVLAKHPGSLVHLLRQFRLRQVHKTYTCLVHGGFQLEKGIINAPIKRAHGDRKKFAVTIDGREAVTAYTVIERYHQLRWLDSQLTIPDGGAELSVEAIKELRKHRATYTQGFSLVECQPKTGRTHQIRVHMTHVKHPLVGDAVYVGRKRASLDHLWCPRQFLHASRLTFTHPRSGEPTSFESTLPSDLRLALQQLS